MRTSSPSGADCVYAFRHSICNQRAQTWTRSSCPVFFLAGLLSICNWSFMDRWSCYERAGSILLIRTPAPIFWGSGAVLNLGRTCKSIPYLKSFFTRAFRLIILAAGARFQNLLKFRYLSSFWNSIFVCSLRFARRQYLHMCSVSLMIPILLEVPFCSVFQSPCASVASETKEAVHSPSHILTTGRFLTFLKKLFRWFLYNKEHSMDVS